MRARGFPNFNRKTAGGQLTCLLIAAQLCTASAGAQETETPPAQPPAESPVIQEPVIPQPKALTITESESIPQPIELRASLIKTDNYPVNLEAVLKLVEDQNLAIAQGQKNTEVVESRLRQRQVALLPNITSSYSQNWQKGQQRFVSGGSGGFVGTGSGTASRSRTTSTSSNVQSFVQPQVGANWTLYPGGRQVYEILAAKRRKAAAESQLKETYQEQLARATEEYYRLLAAYVQKGVVVRSIEEAREQVKLNQALVSVGKGVPLDLSRARTAYAQQQSQLVQAENAIIQAEQALLSRLNLDATIHLVPEGADTLKKPLVPEVYSVETLIADAIKTNPAVKTGEEEIRAMGYDYKVVRSDLIPSVTLQTAIRGNGEELGDLQRSTSGSFSINVNLLENLGLQVPFRMQEQKKLIEQRVLAQKQLLREIESRVMTAFLSSENFESALEAAQQELASAQESYNLAFGRFKSGYGIFVDVLNAEVALTTARSNVVQAVLNYNQAQVQLVEAIGKITPDTLIRGMTAQGTSSHGDSTP